MAGPGLSAAGPAAALFARHLRQRSNRTCLPALNTVGKPPEPAGKPPERVLPNREAIGTYVFSHNYL